MKPIVLHECAEAELREALASGGCKPTDPAIVTCKANGERLRQRKCTPPTTQEGSGELPPPLATNGKTATRFCDAVVGSRIGYLCI